MRQSTSEFRKKLQALPRDELLEIIEIQDPEIRKQVRRIEWVFENKLRHLNWPNGDPIEGRPVTNEELALLIDEPFQFDRELAVAGLSYEDQQQLHIASDSVLWSRHFLGVQPIAYQILIMRHSSLRKVLRAGRRLGKALNIDTPIPTPDGWKTMKDLEVGDKVFDEKGNTCNVVFATDVQWDRVCYEVVFSDGEKIVADADHQWTVDTKASRKARGRAVNPQKLPVTLTTTQMLDDLYITASQKPCKGNTLEVNYSIEVCEPVQYSEKMLSIDPYMLGVWLGDGTNGSGKIDTDDQFILDEIQKLGYEIKPWKYKFSYNIIGLKAQLKSLGLQKPLGSVKGEYNKSIPSVYLQASTEQREALLQGLMDTDGSVVQPKIGGVEISLCDQVLAQDTWELIKSLGYKCTFRTDPSTLNGRQVGWRYRMYFTPWRPVFRLPRKLSQQKLRSSPSSRQRCRYIVAINEVESVPVKCISVDSPSSLYLAGKNFIPTHNTFSLALILMHHAYTHEDGRAIVVAPMKAQAELIYKEMVRLAGKNNLVMDSITRKVTSPQFEIEFSTGSTIKFFTSGLKTGSKSDIVRGQEAHIIVLDELDYMHPDDLEALYAMLQKTAEDQEDKILIGASTPTGRREHFWTWCNSPRFREFWFPSYANPFFSRETEEEFKVQYTEMGYRHEIEADWGEDEEGVYPRKWIDKAFLDPGWEYFPHPISARSVFIIGVDWDKYGAGTNLIVLEICAEDYEDERFRGRVRIAYREEVPKDEYTFIKAVDRIIELNQIFSPAHIYVDRGAGEVQVEMLHRHGVDHPETQLRKRVRGVSFSETIEVIDPHTRQPEKKEIKPFMVENLRQMLEKEQIVFPANDDDTFREGKSLYMQLISYVVARTTPTGRPVFESAGSAEDHAHDALILACLAITENYSDLMKRRFATQSIAVSNDVFLPMFDLDDGEEEDAEDLWGSLGAAPVKMKRAMTVGLRKNTMRPLRRDIF